MLKSDLKNKKVTKKFLKKIIAQNQDDLRIISALCSGALVNQSKIKYLKKNKVFLELIAIDTFKKKENFEIVILFLNNTAITLTSEVVEVTLEDLTEIND